MSEKTTVTFKLDSDVKEQAGAVFQNLGMTFTTGLEVYLRAVIREQGIPFDLRSEKPMSLADRARYARLQPEAAQQPDRADDLESERECRESQDR